MTLYEFKKLLNSELNYQEAVSIIESVTGFDALKISLYGRTAIDSTQEKRIFDILEKRRAGYPLQYILGSWSFMGNDFSVGEGVLIPRDDTEVVVRSVMSFLKKKSAPKIIDLCSGSGIIAVTLQREFPSAEVHAMELSDSALYYLEKNIGVLSPSAAIHKGDVTSDCLGFEDGYFDLIISNPPYIPSAQLSSLQAEVQAEPSLALDGGEDGMDFYRIIIETWSKKLKQGGMLAFEIGEDQYAEIENYLKKAGFHNIKGYMDFGGSFRAVTAVYEELEN